MSESDLEGSYRSPRVARPDLPLKALEFALVQCFAVKPIKSPLPM
ncbi:hypothetical protein [Rhabdochromatium marinum]|nr:hypothetical protein [Rhabdochromatium marinum]